MEKPGTERPRSRPRRVKENRLPGKRPVSAIRREFVSVLLESCMCPEWFFWFNSRFRGGGSDGLSCVEQRRLGAFENTLGAAVGSFMTADAEWSPWHCLQTPAAYFLVTMYADAEAAVVNSNQGQLD